MILVVKKYSYVQCAVFSTCDNIENNTNTKIQKIIIIVIIGIIMIGFCFV